MNTCTLMTRELITGKLQRSEVLFQAKDGQSPSERLYTNSSRPFFHKQSQIDTETVFLDADYIKGILTSLLKVAMPLCEVSPPKDEVRYSERYALTITESARFFGIGENKLRQMVEENPDADWLLQNGFRTLIKRELLEQWLNSTDTI